MIGWGSASCRLTAILGAPAVISFAGAELGILGDGDLCWTMTARLIGTGLTSISATSTIWLIRVTGLTT
jgi:hypothetical protein